MQLGQPTEGSHPGESGQSILEYYLHGHLIDVNHYCRSTTTISAAVVISPKRLLERAITGGVHHFRWVFLVACCFFAVGLFASSCAAAVR